MISENWDGEGRVLERIWEGEKERERERWDWREESLERDTERLRFVEQHVGVVGDGGCEGTWELRERRAWKIGCCTCVVQEGREANLVEKGTFIYLFIIIIWEMTCLQYFHNIFTINPKW